MKFEEYIFPNANKSLRNNKLSKIDKIVLFFWLGIMSYLVGFLITALIVFIKGD